MTSLGVGAHIKPTIPCSSRGMQIVLHGLFVDALTVASMMPASSCVSGSRRRWAMRA